MMCQKFLKGFVARKRLQKSKAKNKIDHNYLYFADLRHRLEDNAVTIITTYYIKYKLRQIAKQLEELQRREQALTKDKRKSLKIKKGRSIKEEETSTQIAKSMAELTKKREELRVKFSAALFKPSNRNLLIKYDLPDVPE